MANPEHVAKLMEGRDAWHAWLFTYREGRPDLSGARLRARYLFGTDFRAADLSGANLSGSDLRSSGLTSVDLSGADLSGAILDEANLSFANLSDADLSGAQLTYAIFNRTVLNRTRMESAYFRSTVLSSVDLRSVIGLTTIRHSGPTPISIDTIIASDGHIPREFLIGCGVPESFIDYMPALIRSLSPIQFYSCFLSYSTDDDDFVQRLYADLQAHGVRTWYAPEDLKPGEYILAGIDDAIRVRDKLLLVLSESSVSSNWVRHEVEAALAEEIRRGTTVLFPIRLDERVLKITDSWAQRLQSRHIADFRGWKDHDTYQAAFKLLLKHLQAEAEREMGAGR